MPEIEKTQRAVAPIGSRSVAEAPAAARREEDEPRDSGGPMDDAEYERLLDMYDVSFKNFAEGEVVKGVVLQLSESEVIVDVGYKSEGIIPVDEFRDETGKISIKVGDTVDVLLEKTEDKEGYVVLSKEKAEKMKVWDDVERAYQERRVVVGRVIERVKGGLAVDIGVRAFLPGSQYDLKPTQNLDELLGTEVQVRVTKLNRRRGNVVVSRRVILEEELHAKRAALMDTLSEGQIVHGHVKNVTDYGAFVDLGGIDGLLHLTDLSWGRVKHPFDVVKPEQELEVMILKFDKEKQRISLGLKQLTPDPWVGAAEKYPAGGKVQGKIVGIVDYGVFVELEQGIEGLVHVSEMSWNKKVQHPSKLAKVGDVVDVVVLDIKPSDRRVSLGMKQAQPDPWLVTAEKYPVGTVITGKVRNIAEFGAFVEIEEGFDGLVHVGDVSWTGRVKNPHEVFKKGEPVTAKVLRIDPENRRVSLGIKQVNDIWSDWFKQHKVGQIVKGKVSRIATFGAFVELGENIEALCHNTEIEDRRRRDEGMGGYRPTSGPLKSAGPLEPGKEYDFKIIKISPETRRIGLSYRAAVKQLERKEIEQYRSASKSSSTATIGDALKSKLSAR